MFSRNRLLAALPSAAAEVLKASLEPVDLSVKQMLLEPDQPITHVHFPLHGVVSIVNEPNPRRDRRSRDDRP